MLSEADLDHVPDDIREHLAEWLVDTRFHANDGALLSELGIGEEPPTVWNHIRAINLVDAPPPAAAALREWEREWVAKYYSFLNCTPDRSLLMAGNFCMPRGWSLLMLTRGDARRRICHYLLRAIGESDKSEFGAVMFRHRSRPNVYEQKAYPHPLWSFLLKDGELAGPGSVLPFSDILFKDGAERAAAIPSLASWAPSIRRLTEAGGTWISGSGAEKVWAAWLKYASVERVDAQDLAALYQMAGESGFAPVAVCSVKGPVPLADVLVVTSSRDAQAAGAAGHVCINLPPAIASLWIAQGAKRFDTVATLEWTDGGLPEEVTLLVDMEPAVADALRPDALNRAGTRLVADLYQCIGRSRQPVSWASLQDNLLISKTAWLDADWQARIRLLLEGAAALGWVAADASPEEILRSGAAARRRTVAEAPDLPSRLLRAIGDVSVLLCLFDSDVRERLEHDPDKAASVALTLFGPSLLAETSVREALSRQGLEPPDRWGGEAATQFVTALGFPPEFAASPSRRRAPEIVVSGPLPLKPLHDYQESVVAALDDLLSEAASRRRAVISLPTGAGKTRVAAETAVTRVLAPASQARLVVWIAQTDELCEQAVQCFRELWANRGPAGETLRIVRFWGSQANPQPSERDDPTVVVATIQTLTSRMSGKGLEWMSRPGLLVIDECHHALTPSYTDIFRWLNRGAPPSLEQAEPPVVGLSATPFRGRNEDETAQLARRFDGRLIPTTQAELFEQLQDRGVLARFEYTRLDMTEPFVLTAEELQHIERFRVLPDSALERLGENATRNDMIVDAIAQAPERSVLVFATSVAHARRLAARLSVLGVPAAVISGETDRNARRWFIAGFQRGEIRVLCNHSALTTGFDAPATDLIVIARPVFSPSLYMQMVGRGLRGPLNGGKSVCRILTVQDNLDRFSNELAHHYFERWYAGMT